MRSWRIAESIDWIQRCIKQTQSVQEPLKVMEEAKEECENAWEEWKKVRKEFWEDEEWKEARHKAFKKWNKARELVLKQLVVKGLHHTLEEERRIMKNR